jgi:hypothetical protein
MTERWRIECEAADGASFAPGRAARVFFGDTELRGLTRVAVDLPVDGLARVSLWALAADVDVIVDAIPELRRAVVECGVCGGKGCAECRGDR